MRIILEIPSTSSFKIELPRGAFSKLRRLHRSKSRSRADRPKNLERHRAPVRNILTISFMFRSKLRSRAQRPEMLIKIALPCGLFIKNCVPVRSVLKLPFRVDYPLAVFGGWEASVSIYIHVQLMQSLTPAIPPRPFTTQHSTAVTELS